MAMLAMERSLEIATLAGSNDQLLAPLVDLNSPTPASESEEPFASPVPAYSVLPLGSVGSTYREPIELLVRPVSTGSQATCPAKASAVRQIPPPAAATHSRQPWAGCPQCGSTAIAVTRPELVVGEPV